MRWYTIAFKGMVAAEIYTATEVVLVPRLAYDGSHMNVSHLICKVCTQSAQLAGAPYLPCIRPLSGRLS